MREEIPNTPTSAGPNSELSAELEIINKKGLHARASARFVKCVEGFDADVIVSRDGQSVGGESIMGLLMLGASMGCSIHLTCSGNQAAQLLAGLSDLINDRFGEAE